MAEEIEVGEEGSGEEPLMEEPLAEEPPIEEVPDEEKQKSISDQIKERLAEGASKEELIAEGYNANTVRTIISELKPGYGKGAGKGPSGADLAARAPGSRSMVPVKGMPLESIISLLKLPDGQHDVLERGIQFGMGVVVLGVRVAQELSAIGVQQARPLVEMARDMRAGEAAAAKTAAGEAAMGAAAAIHGDLYPVLGQLADAQREQAAAAKEAARPKMSNPMQDMLMKAMAPQFENMISRMMGTMMGGMGGMGAPGIPGAAQPTGPVLPPGWTKREGK